MSEDNDLRTETPKSLLDYFKETRETFRIFAWVWRKLVTPESKRKTRIYLMGLLVVIILQMIQPWLLGKAVDALNDKNVTLLFNCFFAMFVSVTFQKLVSWHQWSTREWVLGINVGASDHSVTESFFEKSMGQHLREGSILSVANIDKGRSRCFEMQNLLLFDGLPILLVLLISYLSLWVLSPVSAAGMTTIVIIHIFWSFFLNKNVMEKCTPIERDFRRLNRRRFERWERIERVKTNGKEEEELNGMDETWADIIFRDRTFWLWYIKHSAIRETINYYCFYSVLAIAFWQVLQGRTSLGSLFPIATLAGQISMNLWQVGQIEQRLNQYMPSIRSMMQALEMPPDVVDLNDAHVLNHTSPICVAFDNVSYSYPLGDSETGVQDRKFPVPVVKNLSFTIGAGQKVALLGPSGVGKTTAMRLLLRFEDPDQGCIKINGYKLTDIKLSSWMKVVGYIPQQSQILDGTIRYNLTYGLTPEEAASISDDELWKLMRLLQIDFGDRLDQGLDTSVGHNGLKLSGGQAQRLMIGAASIKRPLCMIIDEATSNLDSTTEKEVQRGLEKVLQGGISALVVAHRLSTVRKLCDKFIVLKDASKLKEGESQVEAEATSFEDLYQISPTFRRLAEDQDLVISNNLVTL